MIYLELDEVLAIACEVLGLEAAALVRVTDLGLADSAVARPRASFDGHEFYSSVEAKAASLLYGLSRPEVAHEPPTVPYQRPAPSRLLQVAELSPSRVVHPVAA